MAGAREALEELLELLWTAEEDELTPVDRCKLPETLRCFLPHPIDGNGRDLQETIDRAVVQAWVDGGEDGGIQLSREGRHQAERIVRRHRLTESLLAGVLAVSDSSVESTACQLEHILNAEVTDAVCTFLGHPPICPHSRSIPRGACCRRTQATVEPLIIPLGQLPVGESACVSFIHTQRSHYLKRLSQIGLMPGSRLRLRQLRPTLVVEVGETELALDREAGQEIFVRRQP